MSALDPYGLGDLEYEEESEYACDSRGWWWTDATKEGYPPDEVASLAMDGYSVEDGDGQP